MASAWYSTLSDDIEEIDGGREEEVASRLVSALRESSPLLIRNGAKRLSDLWSTEYLAEHVQEELEVYVDQSPKKHLGGSFIPDTKEDRKLLGIQEMLVPFHSLLANKASETDMREMDKENNVYYMQQQTWSTKSTFPQLYTDFLTELSAPLLSYLNGEQATAAAQILWIATGATVSALHFDRKNNVLVQVAGEKTVLLMDPSQTPLLYQRPCVDGTQFTNRFSQVGFVQIPEKESGVWPITIEREVEKAAIQDEEEVMKLYRKFVISSYGVNSEEEETRACARPTSIDELRELYPLLLNAAVRQATLRAGDVLFLPINWWHIVNSSPDPVRGINIMINSFFDLL